VKHQQAGVSGERHQGGLPQTGAGRVVQMDVVQVIDTCHATAINKKTIKSQQDANAEHS